MPIIYISGIRREIFSQDALRSLEISIKEIVTGLEELFIASDQVKVFFPIDALEDRPDCELVVEVRGLLLQLQAKQTPGIRSELAIRIASALLSFYKDHMVKCKSAEVFVIDYETGGYCRHQSTQYC